MTNAVKNIDKNKYICSGYGIAFDGNVNCNFDHGFVSNVIVFDFDNSSSSHTNNCKDHFLVLAEGDPFCINGDFGAPEKSLVLILVK